MLADFFCPPISFNSKKISAFEQRKDKSVKFTEKSSGRFAESARRRRGVFCTAALIKKRQESVAAAGLREAENVFCAMRRFKKS